MKDTIFRKYDIRGKVGSELLLENVYDLGLALAYYFLQKNPNAKIVAIGMDGRKHSSDLKEDLTRAMNDSGLNVLFVGLCPSPVLYFSLFTENVDAGLMITASHNPKEYNGIKIGFNKKMVSGDEIQKIKQLFKERKRVASSVKGTYHEKDMISPYVAWMKEHFTHLVGMNLSAIVDCANAVGGTVMPALIEAMEWKEVKLLFEEVDGDYPNHEADPVVEANMKFVKDILLSSDIEVGIGFDGDCDRMAPMTKDGQLVSGDQLLTIYAQPILQHNPGAVIVGDIKISSGFVEAIEAWGGKPCLSPSGHSLVKDYMKQNNALLGGELSCHFFFADRYFGYDDAFYSMMRLFEIMIASKKSLKDLLTAFPKRCNLPEIRIECADDKKKDVIEKVKALFAKRDDVTIITIDGVRAVMDYGWGILRVSNTQPVVSLRMESDTPDGLKKVKQDFYHAMKPYFDEQMLKNQIGL